MYQCDVHELPWMKRKDGAQETGQLSTGCALQLCSSEPALRSDENRRINVRPVKGGDELRQVFFVGCRNDRRPSYPQGLRGKKHINVERRAGRGGTPRPPGTSPQFRGKAKGLVCQWHIAALSGVYECIQPRNSIDLVRPQKFALDLVVNDCRHQNPSARANSPWY